MTSTAPNDLARALRAFFVDHLPRVRGTSPHTIRSYRDSLVLLLRFVATRSQRSVIQLELDDLGPQSVLAFLQYLELDRHNSVGLWLPGQGRSVNFLTCTILRIVA